MPGDPENVDGRASLQKVESRRGGPTGVRLRRPHSSAREHVRSVGAYLLSRGVLVAVVLGCSGPTGTSSTTTPGTSVSATTTSSATPSPPQLPVAYESDLLRYRVQLPAGFRHSECLSRDTFTLLSVEQERSEDRAHVARGGVVAMWTIQVSALPADGISAVELAERRGCPQCDRISSPAPTATDPLTGRAPSSERVESIVLDGNEAARLLVDGEARLYVVHADQWLYVLELYYDSTLVASASLKSPRRVAGGSRRRCSAHLSRVAFRSDPDAYAISGCAGRWRAYGRCCARGCAANERHGCPGTDRPAVLVRDLAAECGNPWASCEALPRRPRPAVCKRIAHRRERSGSGGPIFALL
jgi:hypothetical protein